MTNISAYGIQGKRTYMEDTWNYFSDSRGLMVGVFDGHGGSQTADALRDIFLKTLWDDMKTNSCSPIVITARHLEFDAYLRDQNIPAGSTSTVVWMFSNQPYDSRFLRCASLGDSEGYLFTTNTYKKITRNHDYRNIGDRDRVRRVGGVWVSGHPGDDLRVDGVLNISRAFGDFALKNVDPHKSKISTFPSLVEVEISRLNNYVVVATDGLWNVLSPQDVLEILNDSLPNKEKRLVHEAYERGSTDNISCVVVCL